MLAISYLHSPTILNSLKQIDASRQTILLTPIRQQKERMLRWDTVINSIYWSLKLSNLALDKEKIAPLFMTKTRELQPLPEKAAVAYKAGLDYISQHWQANPETVTVKTIAQLQVFGLDEKIVNADTQMLLDYLQVKPDHPVVQSAIAFHFFTQHEGIPTQNAAARLLARIFLYKYGYDCKGFISPEEHWGETTATLKDLVRTTTQIGNMTSFIEYYAQGFENHLAKVTNRMLNYPDENSESHVVHLNERQKHMLIYLDNPNASLSNAVVQRMYKVSQITSSRDLAKLAKLGLLVPHGKGRSTYYTKMM